MDIEQPALANVGVEAAQIGISWAWETGWQLRTSRRLSGSDQWHERTYRALDGEELVQLVQDITAEWVGAS